MNTGRMIQRMAGVTTVVFCTSLAALDLPAAEFYVDSQNGSDQAAGTSPETAWLSLAPVNRNIFEPGDRILLKAGSRFRGQLKPHGSGSLVKPLGSGSLVDADVRPIVIDRFGDGPRPRIDGEGVMPATVHLFNVEYWEIHNLEITNLGKERQPRRRGVLVEIEDFGTAHHIQLHDLYIHDVNGSLVKQRGGGSAIKWQNRGRTKRSRFDGLLIDGCHLARCERNGINAGGYTRRNDWYPSLNVVIRNNLLEQIPGDGIVPIGCDGALVEHNVMRDCPRLLSEGEAAAGIWPWSSDNTVIQYNEVSDHKAPWDAQGFDSDWNCRNTLIQYNYSHDNQGGFLLVCNAGHVNMPANIGNIGTVVRYNISVNDGLRPHPTPQKGMFSPTFHISGPCRNTRIYNNLIYITKKPDPEIDRTILEMDNWGGPWPQNTDFWNNIFYTEEQTSYEYGEATGTVFDGNLYFGAHRNRPEDRRGILADPMFVGSDRLTPGRGGLTRFRLTPDSPCIGNGRKVSESGGLDFFGGSLPNDRGPSIGPIEPMPATRP
jgi:hypothetical protein